MNRIVILIGLAMALALAVPGNTQATSLNEIKKLTASDAEAASYFGLSVAVSGDIAIVGGKREDHASLPDPGAAYVYQRDQGGQDNWGALKKLIPSDPLPSASLPAYLLGHAVAVDNDTAVVGAHRKALLAGHAYIIGRNQGGADNWGEVKTLVASDSEPADLFGYAVAVSGDSTIVGAWQEDAGGTKAGAAYVFQRSEGGLDNWGEVKKLTASDAQPGDAFGMTVAISGDTAVVGATRFEAGTYPGAAYVFQRDQGGASNWGQVTKLTASDAQSDDRFGVSVTVDDDTIVVGAFAEDAGGDAAGAAYVFRRNLGGVDNWGEVKKLIASDANAWELFGVSVALSGDTAIVGAFAENSGGPGAGAAYVFKRDEGGADNWGEVTKLAASDSQANDGFGVSVAVSGDAAVVGAWLEDTGGSSAGAAYVFDLLLPKPTATPRPTATPGPKPVGGIALDADLRPLALKTGEPSGSTWAIAAALAAVTSLFAAVAAYAKQRSIS